MTDANSEQRSPRATLPDAGERMPVNFVAAPHPATVVAERLLTQCDLRTQRRSGPGGQHRNKTSSGVFLHHQPTGVVAEATERRSQADNRAVALTRLRFRLAVEFRTASRFDAKEVPLEWEWRERFHGQSLRMNDTNAAKPAILALLLNDLHAAGGQPSLVSSAWGVSTSAIVGLMKSYPPAFEILNRFRSHHGRPALK